MDLQLTGSQLCETLRSKIFKDTRNYRLARVSLIRAACPAEVKNTIENKIRAPIVIERNRHEYGKIDSGYSPTAVVICGAATRTRLLELGHIRSYCWIEASNKLLSEIKADDMISSEELLMKLQEALAARLKGSGAAYNNLPWPGIMECYPFENYCVFGLGGQKFRQPYFLDPVSREVRLVGPPTQVKEMFVNACGNQLTTIDSKTFMSLVDNGARYAWGTTIGNNQSSNTGARNSELVTMVLRNYGNVDSAVASYLSAIKEGLPVKPGFYPNPVRYAWDLQTAIVGPVLVKAGIDPLSLITFAEKNLEARDFSDKKRESLAKKGAALPDGSFPIVTKTDLGNAVKSIGRAKNPAKARAHIIERAKALKETGSLPDKWKAKKDVAADKKVADITTCPKCGGKMSASGKMCTACDYMSAGGSNSGRHPGGKFHSALKNAGYKHDHTDGHGTAHYVHTETGHKVSVGTNGIAHFQTKNGQDSTDDTDKLLQMCQMHGSIKAGIPGRIPSGGLPGPLPIGQF